MRLFLIGLVGLILLPAAGCKPEPDYGPVVERYYAQFQKPGFDVDALMKFYADDVAFSDPTFEIVANGKAEVRKLYADIGTDETSYRNIVWTLKTVVSDDDTVVISGVWSGDFAQCPFSVEFMTFWRMAGGLIAEQKDFFAASAFDRQVRWDETAGRPACDGAVPPPESE